MPDTPTTNNGIGWRPKVLEIDPSSTTAAKEWRHWRRVFTNYVEDYKDKIPDKLRALISCVSADTYEFIESCDNYDAALSKLDAIYIKTPNEIFARHMLATRKQKSSESIGDFFRELEKLRRDCNFKDRTAKQCGDEAVRDAFISGITSPTIRQRLLENNTLELQTAFDQALALELAQKNNEAYLSPSLPPSVAALDTQASEKSQSGPADVASPTETPTLAASFKNKTYTSTGASLGKKPCFFCGTVPYHKRSICPAREATCNRCGKVGHFAKVCKSQASHATSAALYATHISTVNSQAPSSLKRAIGKAEILGVKLQALLDTGASESFINEEIAKSLKLEIDYSQKDVTMANKKINIKSKGYVSVDMKLILNNRIYPSFRFLVMKDLCCDIVLGHDFQELHSKVTFEYLGDLPEVIVNENNSLCILEAAEVDLPTLFPNITPKCKPIATKSRRFSKEDTEFIGSEVNKLLADNVIETSISPWRAQVVIASDEFGRHRKRMAIDYSQTINVYTELDAYPLPRIDDLVSNLAKYKFYSTFDLKSAYHQVPIKESDRKYTAFEANGQLYQFKRIPFGVTNGVAAFQRTMDKVVREEK